MGDSHGFEDFFGEVVVVTFLSLFEFVSGDSVELPPPFNFFDVSDEVDGAVVVVVVVVVVVAVAGDDASEATFFGELSSLTGIFEPI